MTRDELKKRLALKRIPVAGLDGVFARELSALDQVEFEEWKSARKTDELDGPAKRKETLRHMAELIHLTAVNEAGQRLFLPEDAEQMPQESFDEMKQLFDAACEVNGMTDKSDEAVKKN